MCIQIARNEQTEEFKEKLRQAAKIACDGNCDQNMDDEREQIGKRNDSENLPKLSELSDFEKQRLKNIKMLKKEEEAQVKFFTKLKPKQEELYMDDDYKDSVYAKIGSKANCAKANYEPIDLKSTSDVKIRFNTMIPLVHSYVDRVVDYNLSKVDLKMFMRSALARKCACSGVATKHRYAELRRLYLVVKERKDMLRNRHIYNPTKNNANRISFENKIDANSEFDSVSWISPEGTAET